MQTQLQFMRNTFCPSNANRHKKYKRAARHMLIDGRSIKMSASKSDNLYSLRANEWICWTHLVRFAYKGLFYGKNREMHLSCFCVLVWSIYYYSLLHRNSPDRATHIHTRLVRVSFAPSLFLLCSISFSSSSVASSRFRVCSRKRQNKNYLRQASFFLHLNLIPQRERKGCG